MTKKIEEEESLTKPTNSKVVNDYMEKLKHPMKDVASLLRAIILKSDKTIGEEIAWNSPAFFYTGKLKPFNPKEYKRYIVVFNFSKKDCLRLVFLKGALVDDGSGLLEGNFKDERKLAVFYSLEEVKEWEKDLTKKVKALAKLIEKNG